MRLFFNRWVKAITVISSLRLCSNRKCFYKYFSIKIRTGATVEYSFLGEEMGAKGKAYNTWRDFLPGLAYLSNLKGITMNDPGSKYPQELVYKIIINNIVYRAIHTNKWLNGLYPIGFVSVHANSLTPIHPYRRTREWTWAPLENFVIFKQTVVARHDAGKWTSVCTPAKDRNTYCENGRRNDQTFCTGKNLSFWASEKQFRKRVRCISNVVNVYTGYHVLNSRNLDDGFKKKKENFLQNAVRVTAASDTRVVYTVYDH